MKCARPECMFDKHPNPKNNGGLHCCNSCKLTGTHGPACKGTVSNKDNKGDITVDSLENVIETEPVLIKDPANGTEKNKVTIVVSHFKSARFEDLLNFFPNYFPIIYDKSGKYKSEQFENTVIVKNEGREGETYLRHIIDNYDNLSYYTLFIQDDTENHILSYPNFQEETEMVISENILFHQYDASWKKKGATKSGKKVIINGEYSLHKFPSPTAIKEACAFLNIYLPGEYKTETDAFFIVHKSIILKRTKEFYENVRTWLLENPQRGFVLEYIWFLIFYNVKG